MSRPVNSVPTYRHHKQSGQAIVTVRTAAGHRKDVLLGNYNSLESKEAYSRLLAEINANGTAESAKPAFDISVNEMLIQFWRHAEQHYRHPDGRQTSEILAFKYSLKPLKQLFGLTPAFEFGPRKLAIVRDTMVRAGVSRPVINSRVGRIVRAFKWAAAEELVPVIVYQGLRSLSGLQAGRSAAPEPPPVEPVPLAEYEAVLPHLPRTIRAMAELQRWTGMRPGEVCSIKLCEIDRSGPIWLYKPSRHKLSYRNKARTIPIGPKAQGVLLRFLEGRSGKFPDIARFDLSNPTARIAAAKLFEDHHRPVDASLLRDHSKTVAFLSGSVLDVNAFIFSPDRDREERFVEMRKNRKTRVQPSQRCRRVASPKTLPGEGYDTHSYSGCIGRYCRKHGIAVWSANRLRHTYATEVRKQFGLEAAQVVLGHSRADTTQIYAERDETLAIKVAAAVG